MQVWVVLAGGGAQEADCAKYMSVRAKFRAPQGGGWTFLVAFLSRIRNHIPIAGPPLPAARIARELMGGFS